MALIACGDDGDDGFSPTVRSVAGTYSATIFTLTSGATATDLLAAGASVTVTLAQDGTTSGRLFVPGGAEDGGDLDADLTGTWSLNGASVTFSQTADTFIRDVAFTAEPNRLRTQGTFDGETIALTLTQ